MVKVSLQCVVVGVAGSAFPIDIGKNLLVGHLKEAIKEKNDEIKCPARDLQLFLAKSGDNAWLASSTDHVKKLKKGEKTAYIEALIHENKELPKKDPISKYLERMDEPQMEQIHVLVVVPQQWTSTTVVSQERDVKRLKKEGNIPLEALWEYSALKITAFPQLDELSSLLQRPLPFQVEVQKFLTMKTMFDPSGPFLVCEDLSTLINAFSLSCDRRYRPDPMASVKIWQHLYNHLLDISYHLCKAYMFDVVMSRKRVDTSKTTARTRPDFLLHYLGMVLFRGEERNAATDIDVVCKKLTSKMLSWNPIFYGDLPYTLGYATSGERLRVVMIDRQRHPYTILEFQSIFQQRTEVIKMFYNLPFFFHKMSILAKRTCPSSLMPFTPDENDKRKIELMDGVVVRTIERNQCRNGADFKRLADIYVTLEDLNNRVHERTHLQIVRSLEIKKRLLRVQLSQLGTVRPPLSVDEVHVWLQGMLTALKYWHSCNYCHGDLRWSNIIHIPDSDSGFWVLIDMDESRKPNTTTIDWNHKFQGHKLIFEHDYYQLGKLMNSLTLSLPSDLVDVQKVLLSAVDTQVDDLPTLLMNQLQY